eukprot:1348733-Alexandrium_andersonii.AAC.1
MGDMPKCRYLTLGACSLAHGQLLITACCRPGKLGPQSAGLPCNRCNHVCVGRTSACRLCRGL